MSYRRSTVNLILLGFDHVIRPFLLVVSAIGPFLLSITVTKFSTLDSVDDVLHFLNNAMQVSGSLRHGHYMGILLALTPYAKEGRTE